jgi:hypothetical protein
MVYSPYADTSVYLGSLQLPHITNIMVNHEWEQTELPIERGAVITDHRRKRPVQISMNGYVTGQLHLNPADPGGFLLGNASTRLALQILADEGRIMLVRWNKRRFPNMTTTSFEEDHQAARRADMFAFTLTLQETRVATSTVTASSPVDPTIADTVGSPVDGGPQSGQAVGPELAGSVSGAIGGGV